MKKPRATEMSIDGLQVSLARLNSRRIVHSQVRPYEVGDIPRISR